MKYFPLDIEPCFSDEGQVCKEAGEEGVRARRPVRYRLSTLFSLLQPTQLKKTRAVELQETAMPAAGIARRNCTSGYIREPGGAGSHFICGCCVETMDGADINMERGNASHDVRAWDELFVESH